MLEFHPVAEIFPLMEGEQYDQLVQDIDENDLQEPIWLYENQIIDGRNRYRACVDAGVEPRFREWSGEGSLVKFIVSLNLRRRHLTSSQRAASAAEALEQLKVEAKERQREGGRDKVRQIIAEAPDAGRATEQAAKMFGTNRTYVAEAVKIKEEDPKQFEEVKRGNIGLAARKRIEERESEFNWLCEGKEQLVAHMKELGLDEDEQLTLAKWSGGYDGHSKCSWWKGEVKWGNRMLVLHAEGAPLDKAFKQVTKEHDLEREREREEVKMRNAERDEREWQEREPFEYFAEFLLGNTPGLHLCESTEDYDRVIRHLKNCKLTKLATALEKKKAAWDAEDEQISA